MSKFPLVLRSPAKINLFLKVAGKRRDGYHNIATLFQMIDLYDTMTFQADPSRKISVICSDKSIPAKKNIVYKAARLLWRPGLPGVRINIDKRIPVGAGLGGGSSNGATALLALNRIWHLGLSGSALRSMGKKLGADVPFFLFAPRAWATGIGDRLKALPECEELHVLLVKPRLKIITARIYKDFDAESPKSMQSVRLSKSLRGVTSFDDIVRILTNNLEKIVEKRYPVVREIKKRLITLGSKGVMLSGSGSTVFAIFKTHRKAHSVYLEIKKGPWWCNLTRFISSMKQLGKEQ